MLALWPTLLPRFKGFCSSPSVIMLFVYMKCRFSLSYRELEVILQQFNGQREAGFFS